MADDEREFWQRVGEYDRRFSQEDYRDRAVAAALTLRREAEDMFNDMADWASVAGDTENDEDYVRWLQRAGEGVSSRISVALDLACSKEEMEHHIQTAYAILRQVALDALSRRN